MIQHLTPEQLAAELTRQHNHKSDYIVDTKDLLMRYEGNGTYVVAGDDFELEPTSTAHNQIAVALGIPGGYYSRMAAKHPKILLGTVNNLWRSEPARRMVRGLDGKARAFVSDRYARRDTPELVARMVTFLDEYDLQIKSTSLTSEDFAMQVVSPRLTGEVRRGDIVQYGFTLRNNEVGRGLWAYDELLYRLACLNGMTSIVPSGGWSARHLGARQGLGELPSVQGSTDQVWHRMRESLELSMTQGAFSRTLSTLREAADAPVPSSERVLETLMPLIGKRLELTENEVAQVRENFLSDESFDRWGLANAITKVANTHDSYDRALELQSIGGNVMTLGLRAFNDLISEVA
jgi:hypothetical protein